MSIETLLKQISYYNPKSDTTLIRLVYDFVEKAHAGQKRKNGDPITTHLLQTAHILANMKLSDTIIIAALLHEIPEETDYTIEDIEKNFGDEIANLVTNVCNLGKIRYRGIDRYLENLRKMFLSVATDIRAILIKCADRIHNLDTLESVSHEKRQRIAIESIEILAQIADRLGIYDLKETIETKAFPFAHPQDHSWVTNLLSDDYSKQKRSQLIHIIKKLDSLFRKNNIQVVNVYGRTKKIYSLYKKLLRKNKNINNIYDYVAARVIVSSVEDCYKILGLIHQHWTPMNGRFKDYIANPKVNGYQSLHTTIFDENGNISEIQIRTQQMDDEARYGIAAHWLYKENKGKLDPYRIKWLKELENWHKELSENESHLENLKFDLFQSRIYVFTPKGDVIDLPENATPVDFAYHIHSDIGNSCESSIINGKQASLDTQLKNGDMIEILTNKSRKTPNPDWINFVKTRTAKSYIKSHAKKKWKNLLPSFAYKRKDK